jgi:hypothetical protein
MLDSCGCKSDQFTPQEIDYPRLISKTRRIPRKLIVQIAQSVKCHFTVRKIYGNADKKNRIRSTTDTKERLQSYLKHTGLNSDQAKFISNMQPVESCVDLYLYKGYYFLNKPINITSFYIEHRAESNATF